MLRYEVPALRHKADLLSYRRDIIRHDLEFDGTAGLGNFVNISEWLELLYAMEPERAEKHGYYPTLVYLAYDGDILVGIFNVRLNDDELIRSRAGHIGYHVRPSMRRNGYAKEILCHAADLCRGNGIAEPVVCTYHDNLPSQKTAVSCGFMRAEDGILENGKSVARFILAEKHISDEQ